MAGLKSFFSVLSPRLQSIMRIVVALLFMQHGSQKLFGIPAAEAHGTSDPLMIVAGVLEFFGGLLILLGLFTRPIAFLLSGMMAIAYFIAHAPQSFWPAINNGELAVIYCFVFLYLASAGGGSWSLDRWWRHIDN